MRAVAGEDAPLVAWALAAWTTLTFLALAALGALLRATTHHHGLAGVTFSLGGVVIGGGLALVVRRLAAMARAADPWGRAALLVSTLIALGSAMVAVAVRVVRAGGSSSRLRDSWMRWRSSSRRRRSRVVRSRASSGWPEVGRQLALGVLILGGRFWPGEPALLRVHADPRAALRSHGPACWLPLTPPRILITSLRKKARA